MIPNVVRGGNAAGLMVYLAGEGRANEHRGQRVVSGDLATIMSHGVGPLDRAGAVAIARDLDAPRRLFGTEITRIARSVDPVNGEVSERRVDAHMWHVSLSLAAEEGQLPDERWSEIANEFIDRMGFSETGGKAPCRWVAVHHGASKAGNDHIHLAVQLVREDGTKASTHNDFRRAQAVCRELEVKFGLARLESSIGERSTRGIKPGERELAARAGRAEPGRVELAREVRACAAASVDEAEFVRRLRKAGVLVRPRFAAGSTREVTGYSVALRPTRKGDDLRPGWFGGGKLGNDLGLPALRLGWGASPAEVMPAAVAEWTAAKERKPPVVRGRETLTPAADAWPAYTADLVKLRRALDGVPVSDRATWALVARETSGALAAWSRRAEEVPGPLAAASDVLAASAQVRRQVIRPRPDGLPSAAGITMLLAQAGQPANSRVAVAAFTRQMLMLTQAIIDMHRAAGEVRRADAVTAGVHARLEQVRVSAGAGVMPVPFAAYQVGPGVPGRTRDGRVQVLGVPVTRRREDRSGGVNMRGGDRPATPGAGRSDAQVAAPIVDESDVRAAQAWMRVHAPSYYQRHHPDNLVYWVETSHEAFDTHPDTGAQARLVADWKTALADGGRIPEASLAAEWVRRGQGGPTELKSQVVRGVPGADERVRAAWAAAHPEDVHPAASGAAVEELSPELQEVVRLTRLDAPSAPQPRPRATPPNAAPRRRDVPERGGRDHER